MPPPAPLVVSGAPRSGTTLLYNLFDGHPDISWLVTEGYFFEYLHDVGGSYSWIYAALASDGIENLIRGIRDRDVLPKVYNNYKQLFPGTMQTAVEYKIDWDEEAFRGALESGGANTVQELWDTLSRACLAGLRQPSRRLVCIKSPDYGKSAFSAVQLFPTAKAIVILRDPLAAIDSLKEGREKRQTKRLTWPTLALVIADYVRMLERIQQYSTEKLKTIRYEDLVTNTEATMCDLADWIGISFDEALTIPSFQGQTWSGHSSRRITTGIDSDLAHRATKHLTDNEQRVIRKALAEPFARFGYNL